MQKLKLQLPIFRYSLIFEQIQEIWETVHAMRGGGVSFPHFWWKNHLSRSELILKTHHNHSLPRSKRELASFYRGRIVPASIDRKLVNNDDVPHGVAVDIFGPKKRSSEVNFGAIEYKNFWRITFDFHTFLIALETSVVSTQLWKMTMGYIAYPLIFLNPQVSIGWSQLWHNGVTWSLNNHSCFL